MTKKTVKKPAKATKTKIVTKKESNKVSAAKYRQQRKEYITTLEESLAKLDIEYNDLSIEFSKLRAENENLQYINSLYENSYRREYVKAWHGTMLIVSRGGILGGAIINSYGYGQEVARAEYGEVVKA